MEYNDLLLRRMRERLERYRKENREKGRDLQWHIVAERVFPEKLDMDDDEEVSFKNEAESLRSFAAGKRVPVDSRLDAISKFLLAEGYLDKDQLRTTDAIPEEVRALYRFTASEEQQLHNTLQKLGCAFAAVRHSPHNRHEISILRFDAESGGVKVREVVHWTSAAPQALEVDGLERFAARHSMASVRREGWLVELNSGQLLLFLRDPKIGEMECATVISDGREQTLYNYTGEMRVLRHKSFLNPDGYVPYVDRIRGESENVPSSMVDTGIANWMAEELWRYQRDQSWPK